MRIITVYRHVLASTKKAEYLFGMLTYLYHSLSLKSYLHVLQLTPAAVGEL